MEKLKTRSTATAIAVVIVILATIFGVHRSVNAQVKKAENAFFTGVYLEDEGYYEKSIESQLEQRANAANGILSIAAGIDSIKDETDDLRKARESLLEATKYSAKYNANEKLQKAYEKLLPVLEKQEFPENMSSALKSYCTTMNGAQTVIERSHYNDSIDEFKHDTLGTFPVSLLKYIAFTDAPEKYE